MLLDISNYRDIFDYSTIQIKFYEIFESNFKNINSCLKNAVRQGYLRDSLKKVNLSLDYDMGVFLYLSHLKSYLKHSLLYKCVDVPARPKKQISYSQFKFLQDKGIFI